MPTAKTEDKGDDLAAKLAEAEARVATLTQERDDARKPKPLSDAIDPLEVKRLKEQVEDLTKKAADAVERERQAGIRAMTEKLRVPAFREHLAAILDLATAEPAKTVKFTVDEKRVDVPVINVVGDLIERLNKASEHMFREMGSAGDLRRDDVPRDEDPGAELDRLTRAHMSKNGVKSYGEAMHAVLDDPGNAELKRTYALRN